MDIITLGEAIIDFFAVESGVGLSEVSQFIKVPGGGTANVAAGSAKLGATSSFIGRVGDDYFGHFLENILSSNQVDTSLMQFDQEAGTGMAFISVPTPTSREFLFYINQSAVMMLDKDEFDIEKMTKAKIFHFSSISLIADPARKSTLEAVEIARSSGSVISYDPNLRLDLWPDEAYTRKTIKNAVSLADIVKLNDDEIKFIFEADHIKNSLSDLLSMGPKLCIITMGSEGSLFASKDHSDTVKTFLEVPAVDTTGCGDSFVSALLVGIASYGLDEVLKNKDIIIKIIERASAAATLTSTKKGVIPALPTKDEVDSFLKKYSKQ